MSKRFTVRGFRISQVEPDSQFWVTLRPVNFVPAVGDEQFVVAPEPFTFVENDSLRMDGPRVVFAWTGNTLQMMDRLNIGFPLSRSLCGPVSMVSAKDGVSVVPVWYSTRAEADTEADVTEGIVALVDELMAERSEVEMLSYEEKCFLIDNYPTWRVTSGQYADIKKLLFGEVNHV